MAEIKCDILDCAFVEHINIIGSYDGLIYDSGTCKSFLFESLRDQQIQHKLKSNCNIRFVDSPYTLSGLQLNQSDCIVIDEANFAPEEIVCEIGGIEKHADLDASFDFEEYFEELAMKDCDWNKNNTAESVRSLRFNCDISKSLILSDLYKFYYGHNVNNCSRCYVVALEDQRFFDALCYKQEMTKIVPQDNTISKSMIHDNRKFAERAFY